jgi:hypothetical protein
MIPYRLSRKRSKMPVTKYLLPLIAIAPILAGCGTYVPEIQEFPADAAGGQQLVVAIIQNVTCEIRDAVNDLYGSRQHLFLDTWGVQMTLNLTIEEKSAINPTAGWTPNAIFSLAGGVDVSSDATRIDIINSYHTIKEIRALNSCNPQARPGGAFLLASDLKLKEWLFDSVNVVSWPRFLWTRDCSTEPRKDDRDERHFV